MNSFERDVVKLLSSPHYQKLATYKPPFDPFEVIGCNEIRYSRILAWLLKDPVNREFRQKFLLHIANSLEYFSGDLEKNLYEGMDEAIDVELEYGDDQAGRIDVFVCLENLRFVIAIEVKIWAGEGLNQISRYQDFLVRKFSHSDWKKLIIYLTRYGESTKTASEEDEINNEAPILCMSWKDISDIIDECQGHGVEHNFRVQFGQHILRSVMMEKDERQIVIDLLKEGDNKKTIDKIINNLPSLGDSCNLNKFKEIVHNVLTEEHFKYKNELEISTYTTNGIVREVKIQVPEWKEKNLPFTLMLYNYKNAAVRILLLWKDYNECKVELENFRRISDGIIGNFPELKNWKAWRAVFAEETNQGELNETLIGAEIYSDEFWEKVESKLKYQINKLAPAIKAYTGEVHPTGSPQIT